MSCLECPFFLSCDIHLPVRVKVHSLIGTLPVRCSKYCLPSALYGLRRRHTCVNADVQMTFHEASSALVVKNLGKWLAELGSWWLCAVRYQYQVLQHYNIQTAQAHRHLCTAVIRQTPVAVLRTAVYWLKSNTTSTVLSASCTWTGCSLAFQ